MLGKLAQDLIVIVNLLQIFIFLTILFVNKMLQIANRNLTSSIVAFCFKFCFYKPFRWKKKFMVSCL